MQRRKVDRKSAFRAALALAGTTQEKWAVDHDITPGHLSMVLNGRRESLSLLTRVEQFTQEYLKAA